jgi:hypothetical protein
LCTREIIKDTLIFVIRVHVISHLRSITDPAPLSRIYYWTAKDCSRVRPVYLSRFLQSRSASTLLQSIVEVNNTRVSLSCSLERYSASLTFAHTTAPRCAAREHSLYSKSVCTFMYFFLNIYRFSFL